MDFKEYKESLLSYLERLKAYTEEDIKNNAALSDEEKGERGLLITNAHVLSGEGKEYELSAPNNNTKLRAGDRVTLKGEGQKGYIAAEVIENGFDRISLSSDRVLEVGKGYRIEVVETVLIGTLITLIESIEKGTPGSAFLEILAGIVQPSKQGLGALRFGQRRLPETMNERQREACLAVFKRPSVYCIQGPPGTGKTDVLANIALAFIREQRQVLILSKTHQAVNNALNKIAKMEASVPIVKIGNVLKAQELVGGVESLENFSKYVSRRKQSKKKKGQEQADVIGMTLQGAYVNMGLRNSPVLPMVVMVDEAGQVP